MRVLGIRGVVVALIGAIAAAAAWISSPTTPLARAEEREVLRDGTILVPGIQLYDGSWAFYHAGLARPTDRVDPPDGSGVAIRRVGSRTLHGRTVDVYRYVLVPAEDASAEGCGALSAAREAAVPPTFASPTEDYVDPTTGVLVGGSDRFTPPPPAEPAADGGCRRR